MSLLDASTPEQHRERYLELKRNAAQRLRAQAPRELAPSVARPLTRDEILWRETIPDGWYWSRKINRGEKLRIVNTSGRASVSTLIWNADDVSERYNAGDTVKIQWNALLGKGDVLFSDMGRVLASITEDSGADHDALVGGSTKATNEQRYGGAPVRNTRDNFCLAAAKLGLTRRDIMPCVTFFAPVRTDAKGALAWSEASRKAGDFVELRAEMNLLIALSNCPHPYDPRPDYAPGSVEATVFRAMPADEADLCRGASEEARRGFENTDALFGA
ncbi:urea amidolyase associated protein UAAP1 [Methylocella tundrae]|uniref:Urea carboxylase n=1 Tax=Methylocella tundrae TaxID=227605 RepID=A0A4U8Z3H0_METTU|nr:urea amidolyase associated protein UAAP1 [Methylocella tundrae]WPP03782.1 urea carboxylase-associated family protein [Methylocella tundrae]VFU09945.1 Urea carboxylase [Methylocella tundrae]